MATSDVRAEQRTVMQYWLESRMIPLDTLILSKATRTSPECITALEYKLLSRFRKENPAAELMGRPLLRSTSNVTKVESAINNDRRHTVRDLAEISG